ncbi:MAG: hypothetical protein KF900_03695 [Bacteroidetes bacterium]|nr:hypothetical protein [Bacteroidota bacterium]
MIQEYLHIELNPVSFQETDLKKGTWLALLYARRIPPHIGLIINGSYNSLNIKGQELNVSTEALLKLISQRNIETTFIKIAAHPVFSGDYQLNVFQECVKQFQSVEKNATCLFPVKLFFREFYALQLNQEELLFDFLVRLHNNHFLEWFTTQNFSSQRLEIPFYTKEELQRRIEQERGN